MKNRINFYLIILLLLYSCNGENNNNISKQVKLNGAFDELVGSQFDTTLLCVGLLDSSRVSFKMELAHSFTHYLILYLSEGMCTSCVQDAIKFLQVELKSLSPSQIKLITMYSNIRTPSILLKINNNQLPFCNVDNPPIRINTSELEKPVFLVVNRDGKISNYFQLKDEMKSRMRASIQILNN